MNIINENNKLTSNTISMEKNDQMLIDGDKTMELKKTQQGASIAEDNNGSLYEIERTDKEIIQISSLDK